ncbi:thiol:disulfide interchange protein DsbA/DsbL [Burkholderiales bacterium]|nr:thiol:disulfide interchange protein DsbA/DsbL [Burkholderiales bacterium]
MAPLLFFLFVGNLEANPVLGEDFERFDTPSSVVDDDVELIEFFSYSCFGCYQIGPDVDRWLLSKDQTVNFELVPIAEGGRAIKLAQMFFTLELMGYLAAMHYEVFSAIHDQGKNLWDLDVRKRWVGSKGIDAERFEEISNSDQVSKRIEEARELGDFFNVMTTPTLIIDRRYWTSAGMIQSRDRLASVLDYLLEQASLNRQSMTQSP